MLADSNLPIYAIQPQHAALRAWMVQTLLSLNFQVQHLNSVRVLRWEDVTGI